MMKDRLYDIIRESVDRVLNEKDSISYDVLSMTNYYRGIINKELNLGNFQKVIKRVISVQNGSDTFVNKIDCKILQIDVDYRVNDAFDKLKRIIVKVYEFPNYDSLQEFYEECEIGGESRLNNGLIIINGFSINGKVSMDSIKTVLQHEIEHFLQYGLGRVSDKNNWMYTSTANLSSPKNSCKHIIARLFYFFNDREIDAKMHELYFELRKEQIKNPNDLRKCKAVKEKNRYLELLNKLINNFDDDEINNELFSYKMNKIKFLSYINKQIDRFERKTMRVMMEYFEEIENIRTKKRIRENGC